MLLFDEIFVGISVFFQDHMRRWNDKDVPSHMIISGPSPGQSGHEKPFSKSMSSNFKKDSQVMEHPCHSNVACGLGRILKCQQKPHQKRSQGMFRRQNNQHCSIYIRI
jgi:hypothetical protein